MVGLVEIPHRNGLLLSDGGVLLSLGSADGGAPCPSTCLVRKKALMQTERKYWFPAKRYGWGWGIPDCWQGWLVLAAFAGLFVVGSFLFPPGARPGAYLAYIAALSGLLIGICWLKGEPPRWRWGKDGPA